MAMRITTLLEDLTLGGIEIPLRRLATSPNRLKAASWRKLLELVDYLQTSEPVREVSGFILFEDLVVSEPAPSNPARDQKL